VTRLAGGPSRDRPGGVEPPGVRVIVPPRSPAARRRLGFLLAAFGATGLLLFGVSLLFVAGPLDGDQGPLGLEGQRRQLVAMIDASSDAIADAEAAASNVDGSLSATSTAAGSASGFIQELGGTMQSLAGSLRSSPLGIALSGPADDLDRVAARATEVASDLEQASGSVELAAGDISALSSNLGQMRDELAQIRESFAGQIDVAGWRLVVGAMLVWLAIPAAVSLALGLRWLDVRLRLPVRR
jgi:hypothetical protein